MRRSAAPSQTSGLSSGPSSKRQKFVAPSYKPRDSGPPLGSLKNNDRQTILTPATNRSQNLFSHVIKNRDNDDNARLKSPRNESSSSEPDHLNQFPYSKNTSDHGPQQQLPPTSSNEARSQNVQFERRDVSTIASLVRKTTPHTLQRNAEERNQSITSQHALVPANECDSLLVAESEDFIGNALSVENAVLPKNDDIQQPETRGTEPKTDVRYFSVVWCKLSKKKHKKWEGDAVLTTSGRSVTLYDMEGKIIGRGTGYKITQLESLKEDETLAVGGKEILVMSYLTEDQFKSGKCFSSASASTGTTSTTSGSKVPVRSQGMRKQFVNPLLKNGDKRNQVNTDVGSQLSLTAKYDPNAPDAVVMPRPSPDHQWKHNKQGLPIVDVVVDPYLSTSLRHHQRAGVVFLYECVMGMRNYHGEGAILADDMGLGKTLQCISLIWTLLKQGPYGGKPVVKKVLIVTPGSLVKNWFLEFKKWLGTERLSVYAVSADKRADEFVKSSLHPVLIISYEMLVRCFDLIKEVPFDLIVCDEGHRLKNTSIKTTALIMSLPCRKRIVLTGTPVQNDLQEFYSIVEFCNPGILGSSAAFRRVYEEAIVASRQPKATAAQCELGAERAQELTRLTQMFVLRRTQEINNDYLPPKVELVLFCQPTALQLSIYRQLIHSKIIRRCLTGNLAGSPHLICIGALKQLCNHPGLVYRKAVEAKMRKDDEGQENHDKWEDSIYDGLLPYFPDTFDASTVSLEDSGKLQVLSGLLASIFSHSSTEKVVLVSNHTKTLDFLQVFCDLQGFTYLRLDGQTPTAQRQDIVSKFNAKYSPQRIFLLSSKAGGVGLNLIGASRLILYDIDWNPANDLQAMARVWRDGQKGKVHIYRLLTTGTIEEKVYQRQITKQGLSGAVMDLSNKNNVQFSLEDLKDLFSLNEKTECETHSMLSCQCGGDPASTPEKPVRNVVEEERHCQLGKLATKAQKGRATNLTMAELLHWNHWRGEFAASQKTWCLDEAGSSLSFVFWHEINAA